MKYPFDSVKTWEKVPETLVNHCRQMIHHIAKNACREEFDLGSREWIECALKNPEWASQQLINCNKATVFAEQTMQEHVLPKLEALGRARPEGAGECKYDLDVSLGQTSTLARICARHVSREGRTADKNVILKEFQTRAGRGDEGGRER